jgi:alpha-D-ribose 1-methylphosphonate 5-triphosphate synthase subunit PhnG
VDGVERLPLADGAVQIGLGRALGRDAEHADAALHEGDGVAAQVVRAHAVREVVGEIEVVQHAEHRLEVRPHVHHLVEDDQLPRAEDGPEQIRPVFQAGEGDRPIELAARPAPARVAGAEDAAMRAPDAGHERARARADAERVLPGAVAEAACEEAIEVADVDAVQEVERLERIGAAPVGFVQHDARVGERGEMVGLGEEALAGILEDRVELGILGEHPVRVVVA